jgi:two-component system, cell cycle response regulator DivK
MERATPLVIVVDEPDTRLMYEIGLSLLGLSVVTAGDADSAFALACQLRPDAVVTEVWLETGRGNGYALAQRLHDDARTASIPVLMVSGWIGVDHLERARRTGCAALLAKPCSIDALFEAIMSAVSVSRMEPAERFRGAQTHPERAMTDSACPAPPPD